MTNKEKINLDGLPFEEVYRLQNQISKTLKKVFWISIISGFILGFLTQTFIISLTLL